MLFKKPIRSVRRVFLHCTASDAPSADNVATITTWHKLRGFNTIGYHYLIHKDGSISPGRNLEATPAAQAGNNLGTIAICLHGLKKDLFTEAQFTTLKQLVSEINKAYSGKVTFHGHREVANKSCPVFDYKTVLGLDKQGYTKLGV